MGSAKACEPGGVRSNSKLLKLFRPFNLDAKACKAYIRPRARGEIDDRLDAQIFQNLRAEADFAPLLLAHGV